MYDFHCHTTMSDGELLPTELIRRMAVLGYTEMAISDHADFSNVRELIRAEEAVKRIDSGRYDVMILNFANSDMVGHTGVMDAAVAAVHAVDECVDEVVSAILNNGGRCIITADHGNSELMWDEKENVPFTAHTTFPVPCVYIDDAHRDAKLRTGGRLSDLAPTLLDMLGLDLPAEMTGRTLIER